MVLRRAVARSIRKGAAACLLTLTLAVAGAGCASSSLRGGLGPPVTAVLPPDLPKDMKDRLAISDTPTPLPTPTPSPSPEISRRHHRKSRKKKSPPPAAAAEAPAPPPPVIYPSRRPKIDPVWIGEKLTYEVTYFGVVAGNFTLEALPDKAVGDRKVYHFRGTAETSKVFSLFYRLDDVVETFMDYDGLFSHRFHITLDESKQARDSLELYDSVKAQTFYWNKWNRRDAGYVETKEFDPITPFPQDSLSSLYYLRMVPLPMGQTFSFPVVSEGKTWEAEVSVLRRELADSPMGEVPTIVLKPETKYQGVLQKKGDSFLWLTDDDRRYPVRLEAKVKVGTVVAVLKKIEPGKRPSP